MSLPSNSSILSAASSIAGHDSFQIQNLPDGNFKLFDLSQSTLFELVEADPTLVAQALAAAVEIDRKRSVPTSMTVAQAKIALFDHTLDSNGNMILSTPGQPNLLDLTESVVVQYNNPRITLWYNNAQIWERENTYVLGIGLELGLTSEQIDELFLYASTLSQ